MSVTGCLWSPSDTLAVAFDFARVDTEGTLND